MPSNLGDDTDTTAAIYGQLAGAHLWVPKTAGRVGETYLCKKVYAKTKQMDCTRREKMVSTPRATSFHFIVTSSTSSR